MGGACLSAVLLGAYALADREYRPTTPRQEAIGWLALAMVAVALCALNLLVSRRLGHAGTTLGVTFLLAQGIYCWMFELRLGWLWLRDVWLLWTPVFVFFLIADLWGHLVGNPVGLGEFLTGGAGFGGLAVGTHVLRAAFTADR